MVYIVVGIAVVAVLFPGLFKFVTSILGFIWDIIGTIVMFFVDLIGSINFGFLGDGLDWLLRMLDKAVSPVANILPDSFIVPVILLILLGVLFMVLDRSGSELDAGSLDFGLKMNYAWCSASLNLGLLAAASGHPLRSLSGVLDSYFTDYPMTLSNFSEWHGMAQGMLVLALIGGLIVSVLYGRFNGIRSAARVWVGLAFCGVLGFVLMRARLVIFNWLGNNLGFIGRILNAPMVVIEVIVFIQFFFGIVVFLMPSGMIASINEAREERERRAMAKPDDEDAGGFDFAPEQDDDFPTYVTDEDGNNYHVERSGDFIYISLPSGNRISTKWEYVKGNPYFDLEGKRFYPH